MGRMAQRTGTDTGTTPIGAGMAVVGHLLGLVGQWAGLAAPEAPPPCAAAITYVSTDRRAATR
jgi:hypothetical protein